jgi:hypothetical protein
MGGQSHPWRINWGKKIAGILYPNGIAPVDFVAHCQPNASFQRL